METRKFEFEIPLVTYWRVKKAAKFLGYNPDEMLRNCISEGLTLMLRKSDRRKQIYEKKVVDLHAETC